MRGKTLAMCSIVGLATVMGGLAPVAAPPDDSLTEFGLPPAPVRTMVTMGGRPYLVSCSVIQIMPGSLVDAGAVRPITNVIVETTALDGKPLPSNLQRPQVLLSFARRSVRVVPREMARLANTPGTSASYAATFDSPWSAGTQLQARIELAAGRTKATARLDRVRIAFGGPTY